MKNKCIACHFASAPLPREQPEVIAQLVVTGAVVVMAKADVEPVQALKELCEAHSAVARQIHSMMVEGGGDETPLH